MEASPAVASVVVSELRSAAMSFLTDMKWCAPLSTFAVQRSFWHGVGPQAKKPEGEKFFMLSLAICV